MTTVQALEAKAAERGTTLSGWLPGSLLVATIGPATRRFLESRGVAVDLAPTGQQSGAGLIDIWPEHQGSVLLPQADIADPRLRRGLEARGAFVQAVTAYRTVDYPADPRRSLAACQPAAEPGAPAQRDNAVRQRAADASGRGRRAHPGPRRKPKSAPAGCTPSSPLPPAPPAASTRTSPRWAPAASWRSDDRPPAEAESLGLTVAAVAEEPTASGLVAAVVRALASQPSPPSSASRRAPSKGHHMSFPTHRPRRLRTTPAMRRLTAEHRLSASELILPAFIREGLTEPNPIASMPGVQQHTTDTLKRAAAEAVQLGVGGIMLFGIPAVRDAAGTASLDPDGVLNKAIRDVRAEVGDELVIMSDVCLDEFTDHGHCGVLDANGYVDNDATLEIYGQMAVAQAEAGAHVLGPSGMMDGQIGVIRQALEDAGHANTAVIAYAAKYASAFYGPFREAVDSQLKGDRRTYQMDAANRREAILEVELDLAEGADMVMVKPAMSYLDILADVAAMSPVPVAAYQISGEYSMIEAAAAHGWIDRRAAITESVLGIKRAGANMVLTYWASELAGWLKES